MDLYDSGDKPCPVGSMVNRLVDSARVWLVLFRDTVLPATPGPPLNGFDLSSATPAYCRETVPSPHPDLSDVDEAGEGTTVSEKEDRNERATCGHTTRSVTPTWYLSFLPHDGGALTVRSPLRRFSFIDSVHPSPPPFAVHLLR